MTTTLDSTRWAHWLRHSRAPGMASLRRAGLTAFGTYFAYVLYGAARPALRHTLSGPDATRALPGDELVARPEVDKTCALDIDASPEIIWQFLVQMGYGRAGYYSWYPLDNGGVPCAEGVVPALQGLRVGDTIPDGPRAAEGFGVWRVMTLDPPRAMVLYSRRVLLTGREIARDERCDEAAVDNSWAFVVLPRTDGASRVLVRIRAQLFGTMPGGAAARLARAFFDLGDTVMEWTLLEGLKLRAERAAQPVRVQSATA